MVSYIKKAFDITKENIILAQPLVIFMIIISLTLTGLHKQTNHVSFFIFCLVNILLCTAFFAGWFYMFKKTMKLVKKNDNGDFKNEEERTTASLGLIRNFFPGVGKYFLPVTFTIITYVVVYMLVMFLCVKAGLRFLPDPHIDLVKLYAAANSNPVEMQKYVASFSFEQLKAINIWMLYVGTTSTIFSFLTMFLFPAVFDKNKDGKADFVLFAPFHAFNRNLIFIFKNFIGSFGILVYLIVLNFILSIFSVLFNLNIILSIVGLMVSFYFMTYAIALIFLYYEEKR